MTSAVPDYDQQKLRKLAGAVMDGTATPDQQLELTNLLRENTAARDEYLALVDLHAILATELAAPIEQQRASQQQTEEPTDSPVHDDLGTAQNISGKTYSTVRWRWLVRVGLAALAATLVMAVSELLTPGDNVSERNSENIADGKQSHSDSVAAESRDNFAAVVRLTDAVWNPEERRQIGDRIGRGTIRLAAGFVRLEFDSGVEVTLEGPAEFELASVDKTSLKNGLLTATVPPGAEGFSVDTPTAEIVDLGTSFGIDLSEDGFSSVSVFDGEVEVATRDTAQKHVLTEGKSVRIGSDQRIEPVAFESERFEKVWPVSSGIVRSTEAFRFVPPWPKRIRFVESDTDIFVAPEGYPVTLTNELPVNISKPGAYSRVEELTPMKIPAGDRIRSFILHYSPEKQAGPRRATRVTGSVTFDRPVLGLIVQHDELLASSRRFSRKGAAEAQYRRQLDLTGDNRGDRVSLSEDRKTVSLELISPGRSSDLVRVIVEGSGRFRPPRRRNR